MQMPAAALCQSIRDEFVVPCRCHADCDPIESCAQTRSPPSKGTTDRCQHQGGS